MMTTHQSPLLIDALRIAGAIEMALEAWPGIGHSGRGLACLAYCRAMHTAIREAGLSGAYTQALYILGNMPTSGPANIGAYRAELKDLKEQLREAARRVV